MLQEFKSVIILCSIVSLCASQKPSSQRFEREPEDQTAVYGESVVLACRVINKSGQVQWTKDDFGLGTDRELSEFERYSMIGTDDEGTYALRIQPVTLEDEGKYQCQVGPGPDPENEGPIRSRYATLTVYVPPDPPQIVQSSHLVTTEDREVELECQSRGGKPASEVNWLDSDGNLITEGVEVFKDLLQDNLRTNVKSVLKLIPKQEFHNKTFTCQAQNAAERSPRVATIRLEVKYAPKVTVKVINSKITELDTVKLSCCAEGNPSKMDYKWYVNNEVAYGDYSTELTINSVTRKLHNAVVKCEVQNRVGTSEDTQTLNVHYSPRIIEKPINVEAEIGSNVTLRCIVDSNPPAEIVWTHESSSRVLSTGPAYTFWIGRDMGGRYICTARTPGFPEVSADAAVFLKGPPAVSSKRIQYGAMGEVSRLECTAFSIPRPDRVFWARNGIELDLSSDHYAVVEDLMVDGIRSTLIVRDVSDLDFGSYNCTVLNSYGADVAEIVMQQQRSFPLFTILAAVVIAIVFLVSCMILLIVLRKRCRMIGDEKEKSGEKQSSGHSDRSSNNESVLKVEVRTNSSCSNQGSDEFDNSSDHVTPKLNGDSLYRYSDHFPDTFVPPPDGQTNVGYYSYQDLDPVNLSASRNSLYMQTLKNGTGTVINPHFSAKYGNPYLRNSSTSLPPPTHTVGLPLPTRGVSAVPQSRNSQFITASNQQLLKPGTLATHV